MNKLFIVIFFIVQVISLNAQNVTITPGGITPALTGTYPRISYTAIMALPSPVVGDMAYDITFNCLRVYNGSKWLCLNSQTPIDPPNMGVFASAGSSGTDQGEGVAVDASGNVYLTGTYNGTVTFGHITLTTTGGNDIFVAKYNSSGVIQWAKSAGGSGYDGGQGIVVDGSGFVYVAGTYVNTATFGAYSITSAGDRDIFVAKYNNAGHIQWVKSAGGSGYDFGNSIALDGSGSIYITGQFSNTALFSTIYKTSSGYSDIFVAKYNSSGVIQWVETAGGTGSESGHGIAVDASGKIYVTGNYYSPTCYFGGIFLSSTGSNNGFVAKYVRGSGWEWAKSISGGGTIIGNSIAIDASGNVYATGYYNSTANFGGISKTSDGGSDIFVTKYNNLGDIQWVQSAGGTSTDRGNGITIDGSGSIYVTGNFGNTATFGDFNKTSEGSGDIFVAKYLSTGILQWVKTAGGSGNEVGASITSDGSGKLYFTGYFSAIANFGNISLTSAGDRDVIVGVLDN